MFVYPVLAFFFILLGAWFARGKSRDPADYAIGYTFLGTAFGCLFLFWVIFALEVSK